MLFFSERVGPGIFGQLYAHLLGDGDVPLFPIIRLESIQLPSAVDKSETVVTCKYMRTLLKVASSFPWSVVTAFSMMYSSLVVHIGSP